MPKARVELGVDTRGGASLRTIARELRNMDAAKVTGIFRKALDDAARPYPMRVRAAALAIPVKGEKHTGLRARIAQCAEETTWAEGREAGVSVWINVQRMLPDYKTLPLYMEGGIYVDRKHDYRRWRHPVFGRRENPQDWQQQDAHPYFRKTVEPLGVEARAALEASLKDITRKLNG